MIHAVRLRPRNKKIGHGMSTYTSGTTGTRYKVGHGVQPSPVYIVTNQAELKELGEFPQFQIMAFENREQLDAFIEDESITRARGGYNEPRPVVRDMSPKAPKAPVVNTQEEQVQKSTGRKPAGANAEKKPEEKSKKILELEEEVRDAQERYDDAVQKERTERTQQKWLDELNYAKEELAKEISRKE